MKRGLFREITTKELSSKVPGARVGALVSLR